MSMPKKSAFEIEVKKIVKWALEIYTREELAEMYARMALSSGEDGQLLLVHMDLNRSLKAGLAQRDRLDELERSIKTIKARTAANTLHSKPGASRDKRQAIRDLWASGKYGNRDLCAEQECAALNMSLSTARKALRNTPKPS